jgi:hypothetical protein
VIQPRKPITGYISVTRSSTLAVIDALSSIRSQLQRMPGGSRDDSSPVRGTLLGALNVRFTSRETRTVNAPAPRSSHPHLSPSSSPRLNSRQP